MILRNNTRIEQLLLYTTPTTQDLAALFDSSHSPMRLRQHHRMPKRYQYTFKGSQDTAYLRCAKRKEPAFLHSQIEASLKVPSINSCIQIKASSCTFSQVRDVTNFLFECQSSWYILMEVIKPNIGLVEHEFALGINPPSTFEYAKKWRALTPELFRK